jgi:hypothetical protein
MRRLAFVWLLGAALCGPAACREKQSDKTPSHSDIIGPPLLDKTADQLTKTEFTAYLDHPITPGKNLIWCATMPLVWNELLDLAGGEIHLTEGDPPIVAELNKKTVTRSDLDDSSYIATAGFFPGVLDSIRKALELKFNGQASSELLTQLPDLSPGDVLAYSYLFKNLEFEHHFEKLTDGASFAGKTVSGFGFGSHGRIEMARQLIRFKLDEIGAKLKSEAVVPVTLSASPFREEISQLIFDKPFLIFMERKGSANPYFALWVDNPELLVPLSPEKAKQ